MPIRIKHPIVRIPDNIQLSIYLIKEELKSRKLFHALHEVGIDDCYFQPHLDVLIMESMGLCDSTDETFTRYDEIMDRRSKKIEADNDSIMKQALKVYHELLNKKKKLTKPGKKNP
ncbi:hypothetical protein SanaruYs_21560 [Chryseotalea sanaruensis]|uniref:Uncharacterized protein n=1 Tax=Chryseotalea sanaruensis TaxID=2482724 RepID=A0A401UAL3_9BACT|nr:hypothetical protein [Chryseotalea sanaruensis]GCC51925.1 hypothetical protein SanaruYs_21560 [Chryseotalea sanaruensis]